MENYSHKHSESSPSIIIIAHDRPRSLQRLLHSLEKAKFPDSTIDLIISIDKSEVSEVTEIAENFDWKCGNKNIINHKDQLGLKEHVLSCGRLTKKVGTAIFLEDDIFVAPYFYDYAIQASTFYEKEKNVSGISLYSYAVTENGAYPFCPIKDGYDNYFMQIPSSWGQLFTPNQWAKFETWLAEKSNRTNTYPDYIELWGEQSWKKLFMKFMIDEELYFVFPRISHTTNFEDRGTHANGNGQFQVELQNYENEYRFSLLSQSQSKYDAWFEPEEEIVKSIVPELGGCETTIDLYGTKRKESKKKYTLTTKDGEDPIISFGNKMTPLLQNVLYGINGNEIKLLESAKEKEGTVDETIFYPLSTIAENKKAQLNSDRLQVGIVVPLHHWEEKELSVLLKSLENQSSSDWSCLLVTPNNDVEKIEGVLRKTQSSKKVKVVKAQLSTDQFALISFGFNQLQKQLFCWLSPSAKLEQDEVKNAIQIFTELKSVSCLKQVHPENILNYRLNKELLYRKVIGEREKVITEKVFITNYVWEALGKNFCENDELPKEEYFALQAIQKFPFHVFVDENITPEGKSKKEKLEKNMVRQLSESLANQSSKKNRLASNIFQFFYKKDIPYLRSFYSLYHNLNEVIRYDKQHSNFYFDRY